MSSASNSWVREKLAIVSLVLASASAVRSGSLLMSVTTRVTIAACRAWSSRIDGVLGQHMRHFVAQHRGQFRGVARQRDQAARHVELAGRQRECIHRAGIEDRHLVGLVGTIGGRDQPVDGLGDQRLQLRIVIGAAIGSEDALMLALGGGRLRDRADRLGGPGSAWATRSGTGPCRRRRQARGSAHSNAWRSPKAAAHSPFAPSRKLSHFSYSYVQWRYRLRSHRT